MFLLNLNGFNSSISLLDQGFAKRKGSSKMWKEKCSKWFNHFFSLSLSCFEYALLVCCTFLFWVSLVLRFTLFNIFLFVYFQFYFILLFIKKKKEKKNTKYIGTCVPWMAIETKFSKLCIFRSLDEHLYAQLSKWVLWFVFVMSKIK